MKITKADFEKAIHEVELYLKPYMLFVNPSQEETFKQLLKGEEFEDIFIIQPNSAVEVDKAYVMDRKQLEDWGKLEVKFDFEHDKTWANNSFGYPWSEME